MTIPDPHLIQRSEEACLAAWPAPRTVLMDGWLLRFGGGHTTRANSVVVVGASQRDPAAKLAACADIYRAQGLPTVVRVSSALHQPDLGAALDAAGFGPPRDETVVLHAGLAGLRPGAGDGATLVEGRPDAPWRAASAELAGLDPASAVLRDRIVDGLAVPAAFASVGTEGQVAAVALGAVCDGMLCLNGVATAPEHRGRGFAGRAVASLLGWAAGRHGATDACLQVRTDNAPALALYRRLGFATALSHYHYRDGADG